MNINDLAKKVHENAVKKGFWPENTPTRYRIDAQINNIHDEVSELHESWRNDSLYSPCDKSDKMVELSLAPLTQGEEELADIIIRALDLAVALGIDIERSCVLKHTYNKTRPFRHGNKMS
jgi:NTP pyrophosphatase (non-canonical NTP hydrolase)